MSNNISLRPSLVCSAYAAMGIGTRVLEADAFNEAVAAAVAVHDDSKSATPGQHFIVLAPETFSLVSGGVGLREGHGPEDYVVREHRGVMGIYLKREFAAPVESLAAVVYTREAYLSDPEAAALNEDMGNATHVIVAVLASAGPKAPRTPARLLDAIGGANNEFSWLTDDLRGKLKLGNGVVRAKASIDEIQALQLRLLDLFTAARDSVDYDRKWAVVAD